VRLQGGGQGQLGPLRRSRAAAPGTPGLLQAAVHVPARTADRREFQPVRIGQNVQKGDVVIVTTTERPDRETAALAKRLADELGAVFVPRGRRTLKELLRRHGADRALVAGAGGLRLVSDLGPPLFFHPGMALLRVKRLQGGGRDALVDVTGVRPGDRVLDCTAGLAADAIVFSYAAGPEGKVTALEISPILH